MKHLSKSEQKFQKVMHEFGQGELISQDKKVTDQKQALAIAFSEARKIDPDYGMMKNGGEIELTIDAVDQALKGNSFWMDPDSKEAKIIEEATKRGYVLRTSHTQAEWTQKGLDALKEPVTVTGITGEQAAALAKIYKTGTAKQLWEAWPPDKRIHFLMDHSTEYFELMGDDFYKSSQGFSTLTYDTLPSNIRKSLLIHHAQGMYVDGGGVGKESYPGEHFNEAVKPIITKIIKSKVGKSGNEFMRSIGFQGAHKGKSELSVFLNNQYNYDITIQFFYDRKGNLKKSLIRNDIKEWEYSLKDIEEVGGFEGQKQVLTELANEIGKALAANADKYADGGGVEGVDLFEDYENIPPKVKKVLDKYEDAFTNGDYDGLGKAKAELKEIGYTFEYYLDGQAYDLRKIGEKGKVAETIRLQDEAWSKADGGEVQIISPPKGMTKEAILAYNDVASGISEKEFYKKHPVGDYLQYKELVEKNPSIKYKMADGGGVADHDRMYNFLKDDLEKLEKAINEGDKEEIERFFSYWRQHLRSIKSPGGRGFFGLEKGEKVKSSADVSIGDILLSHSDQFNADNTIKVTDKKTYGTNTHLSGIYWNPITNKRIGNEDLGIDPELNPNEYYWPKQKTKMNLSPSKQKLLSRINTLKAAKANAGASAQKSIQKKIDVLQRQFDYNPSAKERAQANKGKFALDVPAKYSKAIYRKLWSIKVFPKVLTLKDTSSIVVNSKVNLNKVYEIYSDMLKEKKEKVPPLSSISRKL